MPQGVQFDEETDPSLLYSRLEPSSKTPKMVSFVVNKGWAKSEKTAMLILLGVIALAIAVAIFWPIVFGGENSIEDLKEEIPGPGNVGE